MDIELPNYMIRERLLGLGVTDWFERCGLLIGQDGKVLRMYEVPNIASDPRNAFVMNANHIALVRKRLIRSSIVGIWHTHIREWQDEPSDPDWTTISRYPDYIGLIVNTALREAIWYDTNNNIIKRESI